MGLKQTLLVAAVALSASGAALADQTWAWSYFGAGVTASGTLTTAGAASSFEDVLSFSGTRNGSNILGLVPLDEDSDFSYDNQISAVGPHLTDGGWVLDLGAGQPHYNVYFFEGSYTEIFGPNFDENPISFTLTPVPEPATALAMLAGLGVLGLYARKRSASV